MTASCMQTTKQLNEEKKKGRKEERKQGKKGKKGRKQEMTVSCILNLKSWGVEELGIWGVGK